MVATRGRTFKRPWRRSYHSSKLKSSSAPTGRKDSWCFHAVGSSNAPLLGSTAAEGLPRIGRTSIATRWRSCGLPQSASCSENFVIPPDVFGQTLSLEPAVDVVVDVAFDRLQIELASQLHDRPRLQPVDLDRVEFAQNLAQRVDEVVGRQMPDKGFPFPPFVRAPAEDVAEIVHALPHRFVRLARNDLVGP